MPCNGRTYMLITPLVCEVLRHDIPKRTFFSYIFGDIKHCNTKLTIRYF